MKTIKTYSDMNVAIVAQSLLQSHGIVPFIPDELTASTALPHLAVFSGIRLQVPEEDVAEALKILGESEDNEPNGQ